ncbi:MAG: tetratricopeptide repeat protein [Luteolibacter sp.]
MKKLLILLAIAFSCTPLSAQDEDLGTLVDKALAAMNEGKWDEALKLNASAVKRFGASPAAANTTYGPQFGVILYRKGACEMKLKKYEEAMKSFQSCYKDYPNDGDAAGGGNLFNKMSLLKWGDAAMSAKKYQVAIDQWKKFLKERDKDRDNYPRGTFHVNMAIAHYQLGKIPEGNEHLEIAINNRNTFPTSDTAIITGFQTLVGAALKAKNAQVLEDFIKKNKGAIIAPPYVMQRYSKLFMKLAGDAIAAEMDNTAFSLYQLVPSSEVAAGQLEERIDMMGGLTRIPDGSLKLDKKAMQKELTELEVEMKGGKSMEMIKLAATAYLREKNGNVRASNAAYLQLEDYYPKAEKREENLFHLTRTSSVIGDMKTVQKYGARFLQDFPGSKHAPDVRKLMLSSLFFDGEYEDCITIASELIDSGTVKEGTPEHDLALFVLGGSYYYTGQYDKAAPLLEDHVKLYKESNFKAPAAYFQASNLTRLQYWAKAGSLLDAFLKDFTEGADSYIPLALYDRANVHYAEEQYVPAIDILNRLTTEFEDSPVTDQAYNLLGNVCQAESRLEEAETAYVRALEIAEARGNDGVAGEALYYLTALLSVEEGDEPGPRVKDALPYADKYWEVYSEGSPYQAQVAVAQVPAFFSAGRGNEALERLQKVISFMAKQPESYGLEEAINSYTEVYLKEHTPEELKDHYYDFPGISSQDKAARALLRIAIIGVFEDAAESAEDEDKKRNAQAGIQVLFQQLKTDFALSDLSNYILVKLGDYLRKNTSAPREALAYYDEALNRDDNSYMFAALLGRADVYGNSSTDADLANALKDFERILQDSEEKAQREDSLYRIVQILMKKGEYSTAAERANQYLDREEGKSLGFSKYSPEVGLMLAQSFEERSMTDDAIKMYLKVWSAHMGNIAVSAPAMESWMTLSYKRNRNSDNPKIVSDRQGAYNGGFQYLKLTGRFKDKMSPEDLKLWERVERLTEQYVADPNVKSNKQLEAEKEAKK